MKERKPQYTYTPSTEIASDQYVLTELAYRLSSYAPFYQRSSSEFLDLIVVFIKYDFANAFRYDFVGTKVY